jgi:hypothetical protein
MELNEQQLLERASVMLKYLNAPADQKPKLAYAVLGPNQTAGEWQPMFHNKPNWLASTVLYEIDETMPARGHNPRKMTDFEVGVHDGWRLLYAAEILILAENGMSHGHDVEFFAFCWQAAKVVTLNTATCYRTKKPVGWYLENINLLDAKKKKTAIKRIPCGREHFPPGTVIRSPEREQYEWYAILGTEAGRLWVCGTANSWSFDSSRLMSYQRSLDGGRTWLPCYIETEYDAD